MARVYSFRDNRRLIAEMLAEERGYAGRPARHLGASLLCRAHARGSGERCRQFPARRRAGDGFAIVRRRGYVNFGADWKSDFTISIAPRDRKLFGPEGEDILAFKGRIIRVRGWIKSFNGAMIEATHPEQIEVFE